MTGKTLKELLEDHQAAKQAENLLSSELNGITTKINQLTHELDELENKKAKLESIQSEAPGLMLTGKMSESEYFNSKKILAELVTLIIDKTELLAVFETKRERDFEQKQAELQKAVVLSLGKIRTQQAHDLADEITSLAGEQIRTLLALIPIVSNNSLSVDAYKDIGAWLGASLFGGIPSSPLRNTPGDEKLLIQAALKQLGIA
jgi:hypothetical protein